MSKHTDGPWCVDPDDRPDMEWNNHIVSAVNPNIAICFMTHSGNDDNSECEANAKLIAAAPDLLRSLNALLNVCAITVDHSEASSNATVRAHIKAMEVAQAAIAKATT